MTTRHGVIPIACDFDHVVAFDITRDLDAQGMTELAELLSHAFDQHAEKVNVLLRFNDFEPDDAAGGTLSGLGTGLRSLTSVTRYATIGAPRGAERMVTFFNHIIPVEARTFSQAEEAEAWAFVNAR
ncbi:STAS/SEC14 domain-containing protein [Salipiger sp. IMCC34102]|uniref:STAS/SEC14 domain-containing protein n=1 Tax=Salipiger sp. IMCC34102 TaxID=2510647 RepID=UPI00101BC44B|nr:STAS/SEC14 domain-containing protein [Salipiger sp. IMCC34102]RYH02998.1 STAS/SEC14 domain-containing protein [Salipiger sp. IMCC34102]